nr:TraR/DksA C4-type zinc finger protein [Frondihabitans sp. PhB188]
MLADARRLADRLLLDMEAVSDARESSNVDDEHDPEGATIAFERSQLEAIRKSTLERMAAADTALARLAAGTYGVCEVCGRPIAPARLEARPTATRCIEHAV